MHEALLIDEIMRQVFNFCLEDDRSSIVSAARSCRAWKDPALDLIWSRLPSLEPLISLLTDVTNQTEENINTQNVLSYAARVKDLTHRQAFKSNVLANDSASHLLNLTLSNLRKAHLSLRHLSPPSMALFLSASLQCLTIDLSFDPRSITASEVLCVFLGEAKSACPSLHHLSIRGLASDRLNQMLASMNHMRSLSLRLGRSLQSTALAAIMTFPNLNDFELHAGHIHPDDLESIPDSPTFASLTKLNLRAKSSLMLRFLSNIEQDTLKELHLDLDDSWTSGISTWDNILGMICDKAPTTLTHLTIEHQTDLPTSISSPPANSLAGPTNAHTYPPSSMSFKTLETLRSVKNLRHFSYDMTLPPSLENQTLEQLFIWWPQLQHLEFNINPLVIENNGRDTAMIPTSAITAAFLPLIAAKYPNIKKLVLPLTIDEVPENPGNFKTKEWSNLESLTIAQFRMSDPTGLVRYLRHYFPHLRVVHSPCVDEKVLQAVRLALDTTPLV